jgi:short-subunit dehydrogenase
MATRSIRDCRAIVTGASSGIGRSLALELARQGARLLLTARREERLAEVCDEITRSGGEAAFVAGDITDQATRRRLLEEIVNRYGGLDLLVNNAGTGAIGPFRAADEERLRRIMDVNFFAVAELTRQALPLLEAGTRPMITMISSVLGHHAIPNSSEYCASKFALYGFSQSLRAELASRGIDLLVVSPSTTESEFFDTLLEKKREPLWSNRPRQSSEAVARRTVRAIRRGKKEIFPSFTSCFYCWLDRLSPGLLDWFISHSG